MTTVMEPGGPALFVDLVDYLADVGDRIRAERQARGWTQAELARRAGLERNTIRTLESGRPALLSSLVQCCTAMGLEAAYVLSGGWRLPERGPSLTPQQARVLGEAVLGGSLAQIGSRLGMTGPEVGCTLSRVYQRLGVTSVPRGERRAAAVRAARQHGLIDV